MKFYNEEGEEIKVYNEEGEEIKGISEEDKKELEEFREDSKAMNFRAMRKKIEGLEAELDKQGKKITDDGKIETKAGDLTQEELIKKAEESGRKAALEQVYNSEIKKHLDSVVDEEKRGVVKKYFDKLSFGEELNLDFISSTMKEAMSLADIKDKDIVLPPGSPPIIEEKKGNFAETEEGKQGAKEIGLTIESPKEEEKKE